MWEQRKRLAGVAPYANMLWLFDLLETDPGEKA